MTELYFSTVKILAQRPTHISAVATVLLITKTFTVKYYDRRLERERGREREGERERGRERERECRETNSSMQFIYMLSLLYCV